MGTLSMLKFNFLFLLAMTTAIVFFALVGCHAKPFDYEPTAGEMKAGPGVLTGDSGELTIYDSKKGGLLPKESAADSAETTDGETVDASVETAVATETQTGVETAVTAEEAKEFQEFQQWKKEKEQFHNYQQWKKSDKGSVEFQEFQEYQEWKKSTKGSADLQEFREWKEFKAYQEWKKSQQ
jgi:hypothetical protein